MNASILFAVLVAATTANSEPSPSPHPEPLKLSVGALSFSGESIKLTQSQSESFQCEVQGQAILTLGEDRDPDIALTAAKMVVTRKVGSAVTIRCAGDCRLTDSDHAVTADQMQIQVSDSMEIQMSGHVRVALGHGDSQTTLTGDSITFENGVFDISGVASLKRGS